MVRVALAIAVVLAGAACGDGPARETPGTRRMADTLAAIHARTLAEPQRNPFANRARADAIQKEILREGRFSPQGSYLLGMERLQAGQSREAIAEFENMVRQLRLTPERIDRQAKVLFDFLAIAWLRLGEQQNCLTNPVANVCILPLEGGAKHEDQEGARKAIALYEAILKQYPEDLGSRWLLNIAYLAIGGYPDSVPAQHVIRGIMPRPDATFPLFHNIAPSVGLAMMGPAGGLVVEDLDGDGHLDLFVTGWGTGDRPTLLLADGKGGYEDRTAASGIARITGGLNVAQADYDNDGDADLFVMRGAWLGDEGPHPNSLLRNNGNGTFEDVTFAAGLFSRHPTPTAAWGDFNLDGHLDLAVGNESGVAMNGRSHPSELFVNNGDGTFREVSKAVGIDLDAFVKGVSWGDVNNDGLPDLYASVLFGANRLFVNLGGTSAETWRFEERTSVAKVEKPFAAFPSWFWDFDQDGWDDILVLSYDNRVGLGLHDAVAREYVSPATATNTEQGVESSRLYLNQRDGTFRDATRAAGLEGAVIFAMGSNYGDLDNDGWLDFYAGTGNPDLRSIIPNRMFRNVEGRRFEEVTIEGGFGHIQKGHGTAFVDLDRDGDNDVFMVMGGAYEGDGFADVLFENPGWPDRGWISLELEGRQANRSAIGARVRVDIIGGDGKPRSIHRTIGTGGSFGSGHLAALIGLGAVERIERVEIQWPDAARSRSTLTGLEPRHHYRIVQGTAAIRLDRPPVPFAKQGIASHQHP